MPELRPFAALRYDARAVPDMAAVLCPPYDVISPAEREALAARDARNAVHVELPVAGGDEADPYERARWLFAGWRGQGILRRDVRPMVYAYEQSYRLPGEGPAPSARRARGFFCRLRLEEPGAGVRRHERTMSAPKEDRFRLLRAVRANLSPVLLLYEDGAGGQASAQLLDQVTATRPAIDAGDGSARHRLWPVDGQRSPAAAALLELASAVPLTIADGHHRYETALRYRDEVGGAGSEHVLALLYEATSGGLAILPTHRVVRRVADMAALLAAAEELFEFRPQARADDLPAAMAAGAMGLWTRHGGGTLGACPGCIARLLPDAAERLEVELLAAALPRLIGVEPAQLEGGDALWYTRDAGEAIAAVEGGAADACFLLNATPMSAILAHAAEGRVMPQKSTYFVPKAATGLVFNPLE